MFLFLTPKINCVYLQNYFIHLFKPRILDIFNANYLFIILTIQTCQSNFNSTFLFQNLNETSFIFSYYVHGCVEVRIHSAHSLQNWYEFHSYTSVFNMSRSIEKFIQTTFINICQGFYIKRALA